MTSHFTNAAAQQITDEVVARIQIETANTIAQRLADAGDKVAALRVLEESRKLYQPPAPKRPREWWANRYENDSQFYMHSSREVADASADGGNRAECVHLREVLPGVPAKWRLTMQEVEQVVVHYHATEEAKPLADTLARALESIGIEVTR